MSKKRSDYDKTFYKKLADFVNGDWEEASFEDDSYELLTQISEDHGHGHEEEPVNPEPTVKHYDRFGRLDRNADRKRYDTSSHQKGIKIVDGFYKVFSVLLCVSIMSILLLTVSFMPEFGLEKNPVNNEVARRYVECGMEETGVVNTVTGLILNYRGFDTMGETHVLFVAATCVMILLLMEGKDADEAFIHDRSNEPKNDVILQSVARFLVPVIFVFGIYVILNGHLSPGGGFSGGAILGAGLIFYVAAFGFDKTMKFMNESVYKVAKVSALCLYIATLSYYFFMGANGFENHIPLGIPGNIISSGLILFINIFVGTEVACTMYAFYALFRRGGL